MPQPPATATLAAERAASTTAYFAAALGALTTFLLLAANRADVGSTGGRRTAPATGARAGLIIRRALAGALAQLRWVSLSVSAVTEIGF